LLVVNEPMFVGKGPNSERNYNSRVERALYDRYREAMSRFTSEHGIEYLDLWNLLPPEEFTDIDLHHTPGGHRRMAVAVTQKLPSVIGGAPPAGSGSESRIRPPAAPE